MTDSPQYAPLGVATNGDICPTLRISSLCRQGQLRNFRNECELPRFGDCNMFVCLFVVLVIDRQHSLRQTSNVSDGIISRRGKRILLTVQKSRDIGNISEGPAQLDK